MRAKLSIVFGIIATIVIGIGLGAGNHAAYAAKVTASSSSDGFSAGLRDGRRDAQGLNGHGFDNSCPHGHTSVFCDGYEQGYSEGFNGKGSSNSMQADGTASSE